jgi:sugar fermentation stimulation protein A
MQFDFTTEPATFLDRPNRYLILARLTATGEVVRAHCPDPGRLCELLLPGVTLHLSRAEGPLRRTGHTVRFVEHPENGVLVSLDPCLANRLFQEALFAEGAAPFPGYERVEREVTVPALAGHGVRSRIDYRLTDSAGCYAWVEVKSASLVEDGVALFPDAVTARGVRHLQELQVLVRAGDRAGDRAAVCFIVQRPDANSFRPHWDRDPAFAQALIDAAKGGVEVYAYVAPMTLTQARVERQIPVVLERPDTTV